MPSRPDRKGSAGHSDVFVVDEDTDLLDPVFQNGGQVNPQWKPSTNGLKGSQKGKTELTSKNLEENITIEKKVDSSGRSSSLFPGKPSDDIIDLDISSSPKKPSLDFPKVPSSLKTSAQPSILDRQTSMVLPTPPATTSAPFVKEAVKEEGSINTQITVEVHVKRPDKDRQGIVTVISRDGDLVLGSDGKKYKLKRGPPGRMGPPGLEVSIS